MSPYGQELLEHSELTADRAGAIDESSANRNFDDVSPQRAGSGPEGALYGQVDGSVGWLNIA